MQTRGNSFFLSTGSAFPEKVVPNAHFASYLDTSDEWIKTRTGIGARHFATHGNEKDWNSRLAFVAATQALERAEMTALEIDAIVYATASPDTFVPSTACWLQSLLGAKNCFAFDVNAACSGFLYSVVIADSLMGNSSKINNVLVIGAEVLSAYLNLQDRGTCVLFGDGAGAAILRRRGPNENRGILGWSLRSEGDWATLIQVPMGGTRFPAGSAGYDPAHTKIELKGPEVFKHAVESMSEQCALVCKEAGLSLSDIDLFIPHQANLRIMAAVCERLQMSQEKVLVNLDRRGNTSSASIPTVMDEGVKNGRIRAGQKILATSFGAGATFGAMIVQT